MDYSDYADYAKSTATSVLNSEPFASYKPSPDVIWKSYVIYALLGAGSVLPWYTIITGVDYFHEMYPGTQIIQVLALAYLVSWLITVTLFSTHGRQHTSWTRIVVGFSMAAICLVIIPVMDLTLTRKQGGSSISFYLTIAVAIVAGAGDGTAQGSILLIVAALPPRYTQAVLTGTAASGVLVLLIRGITAYTGLWYNAILYFAIAAVFELCFLSIFMYVHKMPSMSYYNSLNIGSYESVRMLIEDEDSVTKEVASGAAVASIAAGKSMSMADFHYRPVLRKTALLLVALGLTSIVTLAIFPGYLCENTHFKTFKPILYLISTYVVTDLIGKSSAAAVVLNKQSVLFSCSVIRLLVLIPLFVLAWMKLPSIFGEDLIVVILTALLGLTNGYLLTCLFIAIPKAVPATEAEVAGVITCIVLASGLVIGAALSWIWLLL